MVRVKQIGTVEEFRQQFIEKAAPLENIPETILMAHFVNGLREDIRVEVRMMGIYTLEQAMDLALRIEEKNRVRNTKPSSYTTQRPTTMLQLTGGKKSFNYGSSSYSPGSKGSGGGTKSESGSVSPGSWSSQHSGYSQASQTSPRTIVQAIPTAKPVENLKRLSPK